MSLRENIQNYLRTASQAEDLMDKFDDNLHQILWVYHQIGKSITSISNTGDGIAVNYDFSCRGCADCDSQFIPWWVLEDSDPIEAAKKDLAEILLAKNEEYLEEQKRELERLQNRVKQLEKEVETNSDLSC